MKILIVEDEFLISNLIREALEKENYQYICVYDGKYNLSLRKLNVENVTI